jgi:hypothetical protein
MPMWDPELMAALAAWRHLRSRLNVDVLAAASAPLILSQLPLSPPPATLE